MKQLLTAALIGLCAISSYAQNLPNKWLLDEDNHRIYVGGEENDDFYNIDEIKTFYLNFDLANYWQQLTNNYNSSTDLEATLIYEGVEYPQVGVRFKGQTSYLMAQNSEKKSFNITLDAFIDGQDLEGYETFNLNNCFDDPSFMREFMYLHLISKHIPAAQCSYVHLYINNEDWGLYPSIQQLNGEFLEEWFLSNNGTNWRADAPGGFTPGGGGPGGGGPGGGGPGWGDGTAALNYLGADETAYQEYYTLKSTQQDDPWSLLLNTTDVLENTPLAALSDQLPTVMDVDRALWFLASEIAFSDDDSYVHKGKMDYYCYYEVETGRLVPQEYDGNSVMLPQNSNWSPFYNADDENYPLLYRLMQVDEYRQRYLAHMRTIIDELLNEEYTSNFIATYSALINDAVQSDPKKIYTYNAFLNEVEELQDWINSRRNYLNSNSEVNAESAVISNIEMNSSTGTWTVPIALEEVEINAEVEHSSGLTAVNLYYSNNLVGNFVKINMESQGSIFSATIPGVPAGEVVRFYIEAVAANSPQTRSYMPQGAEHDVYYYYTEPEWAESDVVINELQSDNENTQLDEFSEYDDWVELYNNSSTAIDLSGYYLTDNSWNLAKWEIPDGTVIGPNEFLIIWADEDGSQGDLHSNFKLSNNGETLTLINADGYIADQIEFPEMSDDQAYARMPNGTGSFVIQGPTFNALNDVVSINEAMSNVFMIYPNPAANSVSITSNFKDQQQLMIYDQLGSLVKTEPVQSQCTIDLSTLANGMYILKIANHVERLVINK